MEIEWEDAIRLDNEMKSTEYYLNIQEARKKKMSTEQTDDNPNKGER
ncbi:hypothetical protein LFX15_18285 [Leptospira levettii]|nr:hypothetical protein [Leptospira levettii]